MTGERPSTGQALEIAIVGIGLKVPGASDLSQLAALMRDPNPKHSQALRSRYQGRLAADLELGPRLRSLSSGVVDSGVVDSEPLLLDEADPISAALRAEPALRLALQVARGAVQGSGRDCLEGLDRQRVAVMLGNIILPNESGSRLVHRYLEAQPGAALLDAEFAAVRSALSISLPAKVIARAFGFGGPAFCLDAACASSLYAIKLACDQLRDHRIDAALVGGVSRPDLLYTQMGFSALSALASEGRCRPFDRSSQGLTVGEGSVQFVLKRLEDAERSGDRIWGVIRGIGLSNDLNGSLLAPSPEGQLRAMRAAYVEAGFTFDAIDAIECHATGTPLGDQVELQSISGLTSETDSQRPKSLASYKGQTGHLLTAAGAMGLARLLVGMEEGFLPPTVGFESLSPEASTLVDGKLLNVASTPRPWLLDDAGIRRGAVNSFGFGGINAHLVVESYRPDRLQTAARSESAQPRAENQRERIVLVACKVQLGAFSDFKSWFAQSAGKAEAQRISEFQIGLAGLQTPPNAFERMLIQQSLILKLSDGLFRELAAKPGGARTLDPQRLRRFAMLVGLGLDLRSCRFFHRWANGLDLSPQDSREELAGFDLRGVETLDADRTLGHLGSIVASRAARALQIGGPSFTISDDELSGLRALNLAADLLQRGEVDGALVAAVDLCSGAMMRHFYESWALSPKSNTAEWTSAGLPTTFGDAGVCLLLKRESDAVADGDPQLAIFSEGSLDLEDASTYFLPSPFAKSPDLMKEAVRLPLAERYAYFGQASALVGLLAAIETRASSRSGLLEENRSRFIAQGMSGETLTQSFLVGRDWAFAQISKLQSGLGMEIVVRSLEPAPKLRPQESIHEKGSSVMNHSIDDRNQQSSLRYRPDRDEAASLGYDDCLAVAVGQLAGIARLGKDFADVDQLPSRVRLPDEPLLLCHRMMEIEGEEGKLGPGRLVTEHDILADAWYLDGGRIPTAIAVESGQADLFLSGYLGIDRKTAGLAHYRLLNAEVEFFDRLPGPGETIRYEIRIDEFFRQAETYLFRFSFVGTVDGRPLLTMRKGVAGFFTPEHLAAGRGLVFTELDLIDGKGELPPDYRPLVELPANESYDERQVDALRRGDYVACFGPNFAGLQLDQPLRLPGGLLRLVDRVLRIEPFGGRFGIGWIEAQADIESDAWFLDSHFQDDPVMPGTLMFECCLHTLRIFLMRMGWIGEEGQVRLEPRPGIRSSLKCRGQVLPGTKEVRYQVTLKAIGYDPKPFVIADAIMLADGKAIVEIKDMSLAMCGIDEAGLEALWAGRSLRAEASADAQALYSKDRILDFAIGKPSRAFGELYRPFDSERRIARLPGPPYQFLDRIVAVEGEAFKFAAGAGCIAEYEMDPSDWYFSSDGGRELPFAILLEIVLQPCGWLAAYVGSALRSESDLSFRNLGGEARRHRWLPRDRRQLLTTRARLTSLSQSLGMIIQNYEFDLFDTEGLAYSGKTMFGFFSKEALANQVGLKADDLSQALMLGSSEAWEPYPKGPRLPHTRYRFIDDCALHLDEPGLHGKGYVIGRKRISKEAWFFKAHFHQDPVMPGSIGLEAFMQLMRAAALRIWPDVGGGLDRWQLARSQCLDTVHEWKYRGQIIPQNQEMTVIAHLRDIDFTKRRLVADGYLAVDGRTIYRMDGFTLECGSGDA